MLTITVPAVESFNEVTSEFVDSAEVSLSLEHSLVSLSRWESKWKVSFLSGKDKNPEQTLDYIRCMCLDENIPPEVFLSLSEGNLIEINTYINEQMTATTFAEIPGQRKSREIITAELIYYWMIVLQVPVECETWHLNRLLALIKVTNLKQQPPKKMGRAEQAAQMRALNEERMRKYNTTG